MEISFSNWGKVRRLFFNQKGEWSPASLNGVGNLQG